MTPDRLVIAMLVMFATGLAVGFVWAVIDIGILNRRHYQPRMRSDSPDEAE